MLQFTVRIVYKVKAEFVKLIYWTNVFVWVLNFIVVNELKLMYNFTDMWYLKEVIVLFWYFFNFWKVLTVKANVFICYRKNTFYLWVIFEIKWDWYLWFCWRCVPYIPIFFIEQWDKLFFCDTLISNLFLLKYGLLFSHVNIYFLSLKCFYSFFKECCSLSSSNVCYLWQSEACVQ